MMTDQAEVKENVISFQAQLIEAKYLVAVLQSRGHEMAQYMLDADQAMLSGAARIKELERLLDVANAEKEILANALHEKAEPSLLQQDFATDGAGTESATDSLIDGAREL